MTKEDIKKALEVCTNIYCTCDDCPYDDVRNCSDTLKNDARELIAEQEKSIQDQILFLAQQNQEYREQQVKQAKIDVLNELKKKYGFYSCYSWNCDTKSLNEIIDEFIKEVQNAEDKG
nr:MAG TPA: Cytochrome C biogenesis protein [Caudoviricetes sp.]